ncbi:hypothetical protein EJ05DRAFT_171629 [Pseudovirgaria hyperparasitica]|uniref:M protein, serotype 2.1 n=1 Tax=Pseudovirgaria hyperparasitica TaxID=470096 RepID=A0A6A6VUF4_9PEZI|nr:uncharacterized protein EJ05DRAFT_171629 [Pseudovirgaria hyperparasitica]KAF2753785.1 hypothetical protein EJ05DRAFT_171629 [Pseudovirgaria hyperparasitica]
MSSTPKKPPVSGASSRPSSNPSSSPGQNARSPSRTTTTTPASSSTTAPAPTRTRSLRNGAPLSARAAARKPGAPSNLSTSASQDDAAAAEDARAESAAAIQELKDQLLKAESTSDDLRKQVEVFQTRLDESHSDQAKLEEKVHEEEERNEGLENEKRELVRQRRELESIYEAERASFMKQKDESQTREDELSEIIQRLKEGQAHRELRPGPDNDGKLSRNSSFRSNSRKNSEQNINDNGQFAPPGSVQRSDSRNSSKLLLQKDKVIESLRLELAEAQIKQVELENQGGGRVQELERLLMEARMTNARIMEDNESFQVLLGEKTLNGDFARGDFMRGTNDMNERPSTSNGPSTSLADELESAEEADEAEYTKRLEGEVSKLKEQNKALTLYINKIIERVLQHQGFESILDKNDLDLPSATTTPSKPNTDKDLPPPPVPKENSSFLQRAKSVAQRAATAATTSNTTSSDSRKSRPMSYIPPPNPNGTILNENPDTAPSVPLRNNPNRNSSGNFHRRSNSEWPSASIVSNMYRGPLPANTSGQVSPGIASPRNSFFGSLPGGPAPSSSGSRAPSATSAPPGPGHARAPSSDENNRPGTTTPNEGSVSAEGGSVSLDTPSPPRSVASSFDRQGGPGGGAVMSGRGPRPLRLVQEAQEQDAESERARKAANRGSWIPTGWFGNKAEQGP